MLSTSAASGECKPGTDLKLVCSDQTDSDQFVASVSSYCHAHIDFAFFASFWIFIVLKGLQALGGCMTGSTSALYVQPATSLTGKF